MSHNDFYRSEGDKQDREMLRRFRKTERTFPTVTPPVRDHHRASTSVDEPTRITDEGWAFAVEQEMDRLKECA